MRDQGREAYEAMIAAAKAYGVFGSVGGCVAVMGNRVRAWQDAGAWLPTEQHETVAAILAELRSVTNVHGDFDCIDAWAAAGKPGLPKPVDPYGPEIAVDTGGRCPVEGDEVIEWWVSGHSYDYGATKASDVPWKGAITFRRIKADHPGDSYWHGKLETIPESGKAGLDVNEWITVAHAGRCGGRWRAAALPNVLSAGDTFRRWLKSDA
jgi:hypothetical protein